MHKLSFVDKLILLRKKKGSSQKKLARLLNISINNLPHYEKNDHLPKPETILQLSEFFGVGLTYVNHYYSGTIHISPQTTSAISTFGVSIDYILKDDQDFVNVENNQILSLANKIDKLKLGSNTILQRLNILKKQDKSVAIGLIQGVMDSYLKNRGNS